MAGMRTTTLLVVLRRKQLHIRCQVQTSRCIVYWLKWLLRISCHRKRAFARNFRLDRYRGKSGFRFRLLSTYESNELLDSMQCHFSSWDSNESHLRSFLYCTVDIISIMTMTSHYLQEKLLWKDVERRSEDVFISAITVAKVRFRSALIPKPNRNGKWIVENVQLFEIRTTLT